VNIREDYHGFKGPPSCAMSFDELKVYTVKVIKSGFKRKIDIITGSVYVNREGYGLSDVNSVFSILDNVNSLLSQKYDISFVRISLSECDYGIVAEIIIGNDIYKLCPEWNVYPIDYKLFIYKNLSQKRLSGEDAIKIFPDLVFMIDEIG
jgi:hypothetical protein